MKKINEVKIDDFKGTIKPHEYANQESFDELSKHYQEDIEKITKILQLTLENQENANQEIKNNLMYAVRVDDLMIETMKNERLINSNHLCLTNIKIDSIKSKLIITQMALIGLLVTIILVIILHI